MRRRKTDTEAVDDGRTVADMSYFAEKLGQSSPSGDSEAAERDREKYSRSETFWAIMGSLAATLAIGTVYVVVLGLVILIMYLIIKSRM